ncbi:MAG: MFS transporter [Holosporaceae bacterium]|jgi:MFS family permease|nr:MFS transporter [Holosporaceae bacterium]
MNSENDNDRSSSENRDGFVFGLPRLVWIVGIVSFFSNSASVIITAFSAEFIINILGASPSDLGYIRGLSEALSYLVKMASGVFSDWLGRRKILMLVGYSCAALAKPIFSFCQGLNSYIFAQILERITNGLRDTPRDALVADCTPKDLKGAAYGVRQSCAFAGSMMGAVLGFLMLQHYGGSENVIRNIYLFATLPIFVAVLLIYFGIKEPGNIAKLKDRKGFPIKKDDVGQLGKKFWYYIFICFIFMCSRYSESFLVYRAQHLGLQVKYAPLVLALMYLFNSPTSRIVGNWSDKHERKLFLAFGFCMMLVSCIIMAFATEIWQVMVGVAVYGIHYGATQGTFYAMVSDYSPPHIKGTSIGIFNLVCCVGMCISNAITGELWKHYGAEMTFLVNSVITFVAAVGVIFIHNKKRSEI